MDALFEIDDRDVLHAWAATRGRRRGGAGRQLGPAAAGLRFAFYGRTSTAEFQDPVTSRAWQREMAEALVVGRGTITAEFFDVGVSRRVAWERRAQAAALLEQTQGLDRRFDAVVVGEFERAFTDRQFEQVARLLQRYGVGVWLPEAGGEVDLNAPAHRVLMQVLAAQSQREVVRSRHRTMAAMCADLWVPESRRTSCDLLVLVDESAEAVASLDLVDLGSCAAGEWSCGSGLSQGAVRAVMVVVVFELVQHACGVRFPRFSGGF